MGYNKLRATAMDELIFGAGIVTDTLDLETLEYGEILWATTGGQTFKATPTYSDFGEDIDNCPNNMKEFKKITGWEVSLAGTAITNGADQLKEFIGPADITDVTNGKKITPRNKLTESDFVDRWFLCEYGDEGLIAIHLMNTLNTDGASITTTKDEKGNMAYTLTAHPTIKDQDAVPFEAYVFDDTATE